MTNNPTCHPNDGAIDSESLHYLISAAENAELLARMAWNAYYASKYNDTRRALYHLNEARIYSKCIQLKLELLPPTKDYLGNEQ